MDEELKGLVIRRGQIKGQLTKFINFVENDPMVGQLSLRLQKIEQYFDEFLRLQARIEQISDAQEQINEGTELEDKFYEAIANSRDLMEHLKPQSPEFINQNMHSQTRNMPSTSNVNVGNQLASNNPLFNVKLPQLSLPEFSGAYEKWSNFFDTFTSLIHNNPCLSDIQRYYYLQSALKGDAARVIESLEVNSANYTVAWDLLKDRFENKKLIIKNHIKNIFELSPVGKDSHVSLRKFLDSFHTNYRALKNLREPVESWNSILIYLLLSKLDINTKREWEIKTTTQDSPNIQEFIDFLSERCQLLESIDSKSAIPNNQVRKYDRPLVHVSTSKDFQRGCVFCKGNHSIYYCQDFLKLSVSSRFDEIRKLKACINCLRQGHSAQDCAMSSCRNCNKRHNTLLHFQGQQQSNVENPQISRNKQTPTNTVNKSNESPSSTTQALVSQTNENIDQVCTDNVENEQQKSISAHSQLNNNLILLSTAQVYIFDKNDEPILCRALLDNGSQSNFMSSNCFERLNLKSRNIKMSVAGINSAITTINHITQTKIKSKYDDYHITLSFLVLDKITDNIPRISFDRSKLNIPKDIKLADSDFEKSAEVDILLGASIFYNLLLEGQIEQKNNQLILQRSKLGWIVGGSLNHNMFNTQNLYCFFSHEENSIIENQLEAFWIVEECSKRKSIYSKEEYECEQHFVENQERDNTGRFILKLLFKDNYKNLGDTYDMALKRFQSLERKLANNKDLQIQYRQFMEEYARLGHMSKIDSNSTTTRGLCYLPHHCVIKDASLTTKLRVVFDASAKSSSGLSLNNILKVGPSIQEDIFSIIIRFRSHNIVMTADIAKMYRQIYVHESNRDYQRILWRADVSEPLMEYRLNTVTYGTAPASFLATRCLKQLSIENEDRFPVASQSIKRDFYMDDWISGANDLGSAALLIKQVSSILSSGGFTLRQWISNEPRVLECTMSNESPSISQYVIADNEGSKTLGIVWHSIKDTLQYSTSSSIHKTVTKRVILSVISQIFDPLGLINPVITRAKIILQKLWQLKLNWDDAIPDDLCQSWAQIYDNLKYLNELSIPRHILAYDAIRIEIHSFSDASQMAYGACVYVLSRDESGQSLVRLACAKSRVAPIKSLSIPRLELCGAILSANLTERVLESSNVRINQVYYWCDSSIVLCWLAKDANELKTFVANRVSKIQSKTDINSWRYVPTNSNPADILSRGLNPNQIKNASLWWDGPTWLTKGAEFWPTQISKQVEIPEMKKNNIVLTSTIIGVGEELISRFSSFKKLIHVIAYLIRFKVNASSSRELRITGKLN